MPPVTVSRWLTHTFNDSTTFVAGTIIFYEYIISFPREIQCIWRRKFNLVTLIYILERYIVIALVITRFYDPTKSLEKCKQKQLANETLYMMVIFGIGIFTFFRAYAISGRLTLPVVAVFLCSMFSPFANIMYSIDGFICVSGPTPEAARRTPRIMPIIVRSVTILGDLLVLAITWSRSADIFKTSLRMRNFKPRTSVLLVRDGAFFSCRNQRPYLHHFLSAIALLNLATLLLVSFSLYLDTHGGSSFIFVTDAVTNDRNAADETTNGFNTTISFATHSFLGNLSAPLHTRPTEEYVDSEGKFQRGFIVGPRPDPDPQAGALSRDIPLPELMGQPKDYPP
ncbi:hypothetical protein BXZ70DRAFT_906001 [Cristinia sonorae]|uniref:DUF6533 domain-containing protein n=1 Tax=Cristinia sonorae TaxID=1940300 RepID=A0A8K0UTB7_9AGAR|nr:hypothetical protein BXZ70DRAFT_906001 [Cristinia sonorae]